MDLQSYTDLIPAPNSIQPKFMEWVTVNLQPYVDLQIAINAVNEGFHIDTAVGNQLDIIGKILGRDRTVNFYPGGGFSGYRATPFLINYDEPGEDLIIYQASGKTIYLAGWEMVAGIDYRVILKSGTETLVKYWFAGNSGKAIPFRPAKPDIICRTEPGQPLIMNCNVPLPPFLVYVIEV